MPWCAPDATVRSVPTYASRKPTARRSSQERGKGPRCRPRQHAQYSAVPERLVAGGYIMGQLTDTFASLLQRVVVDRTGLVGAYDVDLTWSPDQTGEDAPSLFTAVREQLGLGLESTSEPVDVLAIDRVQRPTSD